MTDELDILLDSVVDSSEKTPPPDVVLPDPLISPFVVIDEKSLPAGILFQAASKGKTTISFNHGKGLNITKWKGNDGKDWITIQIIDAGCGRKVKNQVAPFSNKKSRRKTTKIDIKGQTGVTEAWSTK